METSIKKTGLLQSSDKSKRIIFDVITYLFVLLFVYTAASKLSEIENFKRVLLHYPLISSLNTVIAYFIPCLELMISLLLIVPSTKKAGLVASLVLMISFLIYILYMFSFGIELPCSCGGIISKLSWQNHIWFNSIFILLAIIGIKLYRK